MSCSFDAAFLPSDIGEFFADLRVDCRVQYITDGGVLTATIICSEQPSTQTVAGFFRGIGLAMSAAPVPTVGQWGLTLVALALVGLGAMRLRGA